MIRTVYLRISILLVLTLSCFLLLLFRGFGPVALFVILLTTILFCKWILFVEPLGEKMGHQQVSCCHYLDDIEKHPLTSHKKAKKHG